MASINLNNVVFKHVGTKQADSNRTNDTTQTDRQINIKMPLELLENRSLKMNTQIRDAIRDNFKNLLQTNFGDCAARYDYGANLMPLVSEFSSQANFDNQAAERIIKATSKWLPIIQVKGFASEIIPDRNSNILKVVIFVEYDVPKANIFSEKISVTLTVM